MKKTGKKIGAFAVVFLACLLLFACGQKPEATVPMWESAVYQEDTEMGEGTKTLLLEVCAEEKSVLFTMHTDKETVGEALSEYNLIDGEQGAYGMYVKIVNGMTADYNTTGSYWALTKNGEYMMTGADSTSFSDGEKFEFTCTEAM